MPLFVRFLIAFLGAFILPAALGLALALAPSNAMRGFGAIFIGAAALAAPAYVIAGGPLAWRALKRGQTARNQAVILGLLANFASLALWPLILWLMGPISLAPDLAAAWGKGGEVAASAPPPLMMGVGVFIGGLFMAPLYALLAHGLGRMTGAIR